MKNTFKNLKKVYKYGREYRKNMLAFSIASLLFIIINVILPIVTSKELLALTGGLYKELLFAAIAVALILIVHSSISSFLLSRNTQKFFRGVGKKIQMEVAKAILNTKVKSIDQVSSGSFIQRINNDSEKLSHIFTVGMGKLTGILSNVSIFIAVFILNKWVFLYYLIASIILTILYLIKTKRMTNLDVKYRNQLDKTSGLVGELVRGVRDIKMLNAHKSFMSNLDKEIDTLTTSQYNQRNMDRLFEFWINTIHDLLELGLVIFMIILLSNNLLRISSAIVLFSYRSNLLENLMERINELLEELRNFNISANRVFTLIEDNDEFIKEKFGCKHLDNIIGDIEFKNVSFAYDEKKILNNTTFKVTNNTTVGLVGKSGAGKTTIFNLICKLYDIDSGSIYLDNQDINELDCDSIRGNITIISQNPYIFNMSIKDNLRLVKEDVTDKEIKEACQIACLDDYIESLPNKYDSIVGEGGVTLSGGQKQRLAIARAFIQKTKIILFDEATSALDNETQSKIQTAINNLKDDYTIIIIAHRLSTIINCDNIMVVDKGRIIDSGNHKYLLKNSRVYKKLCTTELSLEDD